MWLCMSLFTTLHPEQSLTKLNYGGLVIFFWGGGAIFLCFMFFMCYDKGARPQTAQRGRDITKTVKPANLIHS